MILKKGDLCKHFKGKNLQEKNIYEVLETGVNYSGDASENPIKDLVIYKNIRQGKIFAKRNGSIFKQSANASASTSIIISILSPLILLSSYLLCSILSNTIRNIISYSFQNYKNSSANLQEIRGNTVRYGTNQIPLHHSVNLQGSPFSILYSKLFYFFFNMLMTI